MRSNHPKSTWLCLCLILFLSACSATQPVSVECLDVAPQVGSLAPDFMLDTVDDSTITLSELRVKAVFINFWTTTCRYCQY